MVRQIGAVIAYVERLPPLTRPSGTLSLKGRGKIANLRLL
jgi:hypothetical protein